MNAALVTFIIAFLCIRFRQTPRLHTRRPTGVPAGGTVREVLGLGHHKPPFAMALLFCAAVLGPFLPACLPAFAASAEAGAAQKPAVEQSVEIYPMGQSAGKRTFTVVLVCDTQLLREKGLQGFRRLRPREAALFVFDSYEAVTFWMGSVTFPIDIVFVNAGGFVVKVAPRIQPGSTEFYGSGVPVKWVIETAAGSGVMVGDRVRMR